MANVILKNASGTSITYNGVETVRLATATGTADFTSGGGTVIEKIVGPATVTTLPAANWNGTTQYAYAVGDEYAACDVDNLQIGIPSTSSSANASAIIASAITMPQASKDDNYQNTVDDGNGGSTTVTTTRITMIFSTVYVPSSDVRISVYGLTGTGGGS